jgi:hypothetical protein
VKNLENTEENCEMIWKIWKKSKSNSDKIWIIWRVRQVEMSNDRGNMEERYMY